MVRGEVWGGVGKGGYQPKLRIPNNRVKSAILCPILSFFKCPFISNIEHQHMKNCTASAAARKLLGTLKILQFEKILTILSA